MPVDWRQLLTRLGVPFVERGPNVKRGEVNVRCPFCGSQDPSAHMGIRLSDGAWSCWRNRAEHSGRNALFLVSRLVQCTVEEAREILAGGDLEGAFLSEAEIRALEAEVVVEIPSYSPRDVGPFPPEFREFRAGVQCSLQAEFVRYLHLRGLDPWTASRRWCLQWCVSGRYAYRLVVPFFWPGDDVSAVVRWRLVGWTARAIGRAWKRYDTYPADANLRGFLFNGHEATGGKLLVVCEGPFDVLKLALYAPPGVDVVGILGLGLTAEREWALAQTAARYRRSVFLLDSGVEAEALVLASRMAYAGLELRTLPEGVKDPGALRPADVAGILGAL